MVGGNVPLRMSLFVQVVIDYSHLDGKVTSWTVLGGGTKTVAGVPLELLEKHSHTVKNYGTGQKLSRSDIL